MMAVTSQCDQAGTEHTLIARSVTGSLDGPYYVDEAEGPAFDSDAH